jgi:hypothetical protein
VLVRVISWIVPVLKRKQGRSTQIKLIKHEQNTPHQVNLTFKAKHAKE